MRAKLQLFSVMPTFSTKKKYPSGLNMSKIDLASGDSSVLEISRALRSSRRSLKDRLYYWMLSVVLLCHVLNVLGE